MNLFTGRLQVEIMILISVVCKPSKKLNIIGKYLLKKDISSELGENIYNIE
jgi:hypothetical protein